MASASRANTRRSKSPDLMAGEQPGLRRIVQQRLLKDVFETTAANHPDWKVLIVDEHAMRVINTAIGMYDIMERKVTIVESLEKKRAPFPDMGAIYMVEPTAASISQIVADFQSKPLYGKAVFLFFLGHLPNSLFEQIKGCKHLLKRLKGLTEINIDFLAKEERAFSFDMRDDFAGIYLRQGSVPSELVIAQKLVTVCGTLNEYPHIRYKEGSAVCQSLAHIFKLKMDEFVAQNADWWYHGGPKKTQASNKERGTLLLLDRGDDLVSPLMHDFIYQPMIHDLLEMDGDRITYTNDKGIKSDVLLDEKDPVWVEVRGKHIASVIQTLSGRIREIMNSSTGSTLSKKAGDGNLSLSQMASALKELPEYQEVLSKLSQHMHLSHQCMDKFTANSLMDLADVEQTLATGKDQDGKAPKLGDIMDRAENLLIKMSNIEEKLRLIFVACISCKGLRAQDKRRLVGAAELDRKETRILDTLEIFGLSVLNANEKNRPLEGLEGRYAEPNDDEEFETSRYMPAMKPILEALCHDELSIEEFPSVMPMPSSSSSKAGRATASVRSSRKTSGAAASARKSAGASSKWATNSRDTKRSTGPMNFSGPRNIVFMMGGLSYTELCAARDVMENESSEIIVGSTAFVSPSDFMKDLSKLAEQKGA